MDAATRAELDALRLRAFGPDADLDRDPVAAARWAELEEAARAERAPAPMRDGVPVDHPSAAAAAEPGADTPSEHARGPRGPADAGIPSPPPPAGARGRVWITVGALAAVLLAAAIVAPRWLAPTADPEPEATSPPREASTLVRDPDSVTLLRIPLDGSFGDSIDLPTGGTVPAFPTTGEVEWAEPLGEYYGWNLWIAGATDELERQHCLLAERDQITRGRCVPADLRELSALVVTLPYAIVPPERRPADMRVDDRIGFWWNDVREVEVLLADDPVG